ncbi:DNA ligase-1 [Paenibacillus barcinonensis]|uniref:DNA ligase-1 n=1 Tax=Paenibacillus barcinonensis TaxID=198119 RepID=A0A2V4VW60_PAEBA|nr:DNA ligase-1 [Paenibacillus barcinonensis]
MSRFSTRQHTKVQQLVKTMPATFAIFDILHYKGRDLRKLPLIERKVILHSLVLPSSSFGILHYVEGAGEALYEQIEARGMEGVVGKRKDSHFVCRRSKDWIKVINWSCTNVFITGYKKSEFGWLVAVLDASGKLRPVGVIEHGPNQNHKQAFRSVCKQLVTGEDKNHVYLQPRIQARVKMRSWTKSGLLRTPVFEQFIV